jgi:hypothetical protein
MKAQGQLITQQSWSNMQETLLPEINPKSFYWPAFLHYQT